MPGYRNPKFAYVEPRRGGPVAALIVLAVIGYSGYELALWLASIAVIIIAVAGAVTAGAVSMLTVVLYRHRGAQHLDAPQWVTERCGASRIPSHGAVPVRTPAAITARSPRAIEAPPAVHYHLHLHAAPAAQPIAIEEDK